MNSSAKKIGIAIRLLQAANDLGTTRRSALSFHYLP